MRLRASSGPRHHPNGASFGRGRATTRIAGDSPDNGASRGNARCRGLSLFRVARRLHLRFASPWSAPGPAGFYAAAALLAADPPAEVDLLQRLPTPWGLVRLGVAPDHPNIKAVSRAFERTAAEPGFRFFGNVEVGRDVTHEELTQLYDAVVYAFGAQTDRRLGIPGEDLPGSWAATEFVAWYNGHPDFQHLEFDLSHERAVVIGNGNVALDVARMLALTPRSSPRLTPTDPAIDAINGAGVREILVVGRRGPVQAAWTPVEVGELGELAGADVIVDPADLELDPESEAELAASPPTVRRNVDHLRDYAARPAPGSRVRFACASSPRRSRSSATRRSRDRAGAQRARRGQGGPDRRPRHRGLRHRLSQRRLSRRPAGRRHLRRADRDDPERGRPGRTPACMPPVGSSVGRAASSARTRRTPRRPCSSYSRTPRPGSCRAERRHAGAAARGTGGRSSVVRGLGGDRRGRADCGRTARPAPHQAV